MTDLRSASPTLCVTFGVQYAHVTHPYVGNLAHPDGWVEVYAPDEGTARALVHAWTRGHYANAYARTDFQPAHHPRGCLARLVLTVTPVASGLDDGEATR